MSFFTYTGGKPLAGLHYTYSTQRLFQPNSSILYVPPTPSTHVPPVYGSQTFNENSFVAVTGKKKNIFIGLAVAAALFFFGILAAIIWYFVQLARSDFVLYAKNRDYGWRPVCHDKWTNDNAKQVCKRMGYPRRSYSNYGSASMNTISTSEFLILNESIKSRNTYHKLSISKSCQSGLVVTLHCIECGIAKSFTNTSGRIIGGVPTSRGEFPWQVSLQVRNKHICGGSILTSYWVLTAAHCGERYSSPFHWHVYGGQIFLVEMYPQLAHKVEKIIKHEMFDSETKVFDVALLKLLTPFRFSETISPICLPNYEQVFPSGSESWVTGWGNTEEGGMASEVLRKVSVPLINTEDCRRLYYAELFPRMICAGYQQGGFDACQGDSGGPLAINQNSFWWLVGATSWGYGCGRENKPGVYTEISKVRSWIYLQLKRYR